VLAGGGTSVDGGAATGAALTIPSSDAGSI
jgi:hypothetical protein